MMNFFNKSIFMKKILVNNNNQNSFACVGVFPIFFAPKTNGNIACKFNKRIYVKVAGFVHKSFSIKTNQVIWYFWSYNWIHDTNLLKKGLRIKSAIQIFKVRTCESGITSLQIWICKDSVRAIVLRICEDSINFNKHIY